jgi:hypothetical protein
MFFVLSASPLADAQTVDSSIQPAELLALPSGDSQYFYVGSTAGGAQMESVSWSQDLNVTAEYSGNEAVSIGRSGSNNGSFSSAAGNHAIAGAGIRGYSVAQMFSAHASAVGPGYSGDLETPAPGVSVELPFTTQAGDIVLILVGGEGASIDKLNGNDAVDGIGVTTLQNATYSEGGSQVIASAAIYVASLPGGTYTAKWKSTTYLTNSGTSLGAVAYVLAPHTATPAVRISVTPAPATIWTGPARHASSLVTARATTANGRPVAHLPIIWRTTAGRLSASRGITNSRGQVRARLIQPAHVAPSVTAAVTATDAKNPGAYGFADVVFLPNRVSLLPYSPGGTYWNWSASCMFWPVPGAGQETCPPDEQDPNLGSLQLNGDLWNLGGGTATTGQLQMGLSSRGALQVNATFPSAPPCNVPGCPAPKANTWVRGYPSVSYGINTLAISTSPPVSPSLELPMRVDAIPPDLIATTSYEILPPVAATYDFAYDMWLEPQQATSAPATGTIELMIWTADSGSRSLPPASWKVADGIAIPYAVNQVDKGGAGAWDVYVHNNGQTGAGGPTTVWFILKTAVTKATVSVDLSAAFSKMAGVLETKDGWTHVDSYWLDTIPLGSEFGPTDGAAGDLSTSYTWNLSSYYLTLGSKL